jgi:P4 family phage/plasmid primase-like protien
MVQAQNVCSTFFHPGEVCEIRAIGVQGKSKAWSGFAGGDATVSGYFNSPEAFQMAADALEKAQAAGIYYTLNPVKPALLARASNRLVALKKKGSTTQNHEIEVIRWLPIDLDPRRPAGISATDEEVKAAEEMARAITAWLEQERGFAKGIRAFSGNGYHLLYRIPDQPNSEASTDLIRQTVATIEAKFRNDQVDIDLKVFNSARIWKLYGTTGRKGDNTKDRPHRKSHFLQGQPQALADIPITPIELLKKLRSLVPPTEEKAAASTATAPPPSKFQESELGPLKLELYLAHYGIPFREKAGPLGTTLYVLDYCLFDINHRGGEAAIVVAPTAPYLTYQCFHNSCRGRTWKEARELISGKGPIAKFCAGYDPDWKPPKMAGSGDLGSIEIVPGKIPDVKVPVPAEIDPKEFYDKRGKRAVFVPYYMAKYFAAHLAPIVHTNDVFWHYEGGVWKEFSKHVLASICVQALREQVQASWIDNSIRILAGLVNWPEENWDDNVRYINCRSGLVDIETMKLLPHDPLYWSRTQLPVRYDPERYPERWHRFLKEIFPDDNAGDQTEDHNRPKYYLLKQFFGYCLLRDCRFQRALFFFGTGSNGKSTVLDVLQEMLGRENCSSLTMQDFSARFKIQFMQGKLVNFSTEMPTRDPVATEMFKAVVVGDTINAERKYGDQYTFRPYAKIIMSMNDSPVISDKSYGFQRRLLVINFTRRFELHEMDRGLKEKLIEEIDWIFMWALEGLAELLKHKDFRMAEENIKEAQEFFATINPLLIYVDERCEFGPEHDGYKILTTDLWEDYKKWCEEGSNRALSRNRFYEQILMTYPSVDKKQSETDRRMRFIGIRVKPVLG